MGLSRSSAQRGGKSFEPTEVIVFHILDGRAIEAWEHPFNMYDRDEVFG